MKKGIRTTLLMSAFCAVAFTSCGPKFTPLTQDQINAKADSTFNAQKDAKLQDLRTACQSGIDAQVAAKVEALKSAETASK
ncbi:MAG: hypothetical protein JWO06_3272 [Bacteroidota bacterium]|nr:hypothetical protein [Bacteroidota bacterium]